MTGRWAATSVLAGVVGVVVGGCAPAADDRGFDSPVPQAKLAAIMEAGRLDERSAIPKLVEQLNSADPLVRYTAARTLEDLLGETFGYDYADDPERRRIAIGKWRAAVESGEFGVNPPKSADAITP